MCPGCGLICQHENAASVTVHPDDTVLDRDLAPSLFWYHSSTHQDRPRSDFDPAAGLTSTVRKMMGGEQSVISWVARQRAKAIHIGSYEAAIHNMLRRMSDQGDRRSQFHLNRIHLRPSVIVRED